MTIDDFRIALAAITDPISGMTRNQSYLTERLRRDSEFRLCIEVLMAEIDRLQYKTAQSTNATSGLSCGQWVGA